MYADTDVRREVPWPAVAGFVPSSSGSQSAPEATWRTRVAANLATALADWPGARTSEIEIPINQAGDLESLGMSAYDLDDAGSYISDQLALGDPGHLGTDGGPAALLSVWLDQRAIRFTRRDAGLPDSCRARDAALDRICQVLGCDRELLWQGLPDPAGQVVVGASAAERIAEGLQGALRALDPRPPAAAAIAGVGRIAERGLIESAKDLGEHIATATHDGLARWRRFELEFLDEHPQVGEQLHWTPRLRRVHNQVEWVLQTQFGTAEQCPDFERPQARAFLDAYLPMFVDLARKHGRPFSLALGHRRRSEGSCPDVIAAEAQRVLGRAQVEPWEPIGRPLGLLLDASRDDVSLRFVFDRPVTEVLDVPTEPKLVLAPHMLGEIPAIARRDPSFQPRWLAAAVALLNSHADWELPINAESRAEEIAAIPPHAARLDPRAPRTLAEAQARPRR